MYDLDYVIEALRKKFAVAIHKCEQDCAILRVNLSTEDNAQAFVTAFTEITNTNWIIYSQISSPRRVLLRKVWICHRSSKNKAKHKKTERNSGCTAMLDIKIKLNTCKTRRTDEYLKLSPPLCGIVQLKNEHNHTITGTDMRLLRVSDETRSVFEMYFEIGLSLTEAFSLHESKLLLRDESSVILGNGSVNPTYRQVRNIRNNWRLKNPEICVKPFKNVKKMLQICKGKNATFSFKEESPWCILIVTEVMKRTQTLSMSREVIYCHSSARSNSVITFLMAPTNAGALPIAILIHENQTEPSFVSAFSLLKSEHIKCFGGQQAPKLFLTDDCEDGKNALKTVWPTSEQLLSQPHIGQANWQWLNSKIPEERRQELMCAFKRVMFASEQEDLSAAVEHILSFDKNFPKFVMLFKKLYERSVEWTMIARKGKLTDNTYRLCHESEATVGIIKDVVFYRSRTFDITALIYFIADIFEKYLQQYILSYAYNKRNQSLISFHNVPEKMKSVKTESVEKVNSCMYRIPSEKDDERFVVDTEIHTCSCLCGSRGHFCKHRAFFYHCYRWTDPNFPGLSASEKLELKHLALGNNCPIIRPFVNSDVQRCLSAQDTVSEDDSNRHDINISEMAEAEFDDITKIKPLIKQLPVHLKASLMTCFNQIQTQEDFNKFVATATTHVLIQNTKSGSIHLQLTPITKVHSVSKNYRRTTPHATTNSDGNGTEII